MLSKLQRLGYWGAGLVAVAVMIFVARKACSRVNFRKHLRLKRLAIPDLETLQDRNEDVVILDVRKRELWETESILGSIF